jgi:hypothetical protein
MNKRLVDKLSSKWICVSDEVPKGTYNTIMFVGGIPEPTFGCWYDVNTKDWYKLVGHEKFIPRPESCWLRYGHSDYPNNKF